MMAGRIFSRRDPNVLDNISGLVSEWRFPEPNSVFWNLGNGIFENVSAAAGPDLQIEAAHRGAAFGDLDNDGHVDAVVSVLGGQVKLFHNISTDHNSWILLNLVGAKSNRMGIGAQVRITTSGGLSQWNEVTTGVGYASASDSQVHFGLVANKRVKQIEIRWPSGINQKLHDIDANQVLTVREK
jgi:enediyne biosynthesis protein E4